MQKINLNIPVNRVALNYEGILPEYKDFTKITLEEFKEKYNNRSLKNIKNSSLYYQMNIQNI